MPETKERFRAIVKRMWADPEHRQKMSLIRSVNMYARWADPIARDKMIKSFGGIQQNNLERLFDDATANGIRYVGDGQWWRTLPNGHTKNPDFKVTGKKQIIELFGDYWHRNDDVAKHIEAWWRAGYECLILWETDIKNDIDKVLDFVSDFVGYDCRT
jgi:hypothetical protein